MKKWVIRESEKIIQPPTGAFYFGAMLCLGSGFTLRFLWLGPFFAPLLILDPISLHLDLDIMSLLILLVCERERERKEKERKERMKRKRANSTHLVLAWGDDFIIKYRSLIGWIDLHKHWVPKDPVHRCFYLNFFHGLLLFYPFLLMTFSGRVKPHHLWMYK